MKRERKEGGSTFQAQGSVLCCNAALTGLLSAWCTDGVSTERFDRWPRIGSCNSPYQEISYPTYHCNERFTLWHSKSHQARSAHSDVTPTPDRETSLQTFEPSQRSAIPWQLSNSTEQYESRVNWSNALKRKRWKLLFRIMSITAEEKVKTVPSG